MSNLPRFLPPPRRPFINWKIDDAFHRMVGARTAELKLCWARRYVEAKRLRGDYDDVVQPPMSEDLLAALARHEAQAVVINLEGERHD